MTDNPLYLPMFIPLWGIFAGITLVVIGYADKKQKLIYGGWSVLACTGFISLFYNLFGKFYQYENQTIIETIKFLTTTGWLNFIGAILAVVLILFNYWVKKRTILLSVLTIIYFSILFFQYYKLLQMPHS